MLKKRNEQIQVLVRVVDLSVGVISFFLAYHLRSGERVVSQFGGIDTTGSLSWILAISLGLHLLIYPYFEFYKSLRLRTISNITSMVVRACVAEFFILGGMVFVIQAKTTSRYFFGLYIVVNYGLVWIEKLGARVFLSTVRKRGYNYRQVLIVGTGSNALRVLAVLKRNKHWGYTACGILREESSENQIGDFISGIPVLAELDQLEDVVKNQTIDEIFFAMDRIDLNEVARHVAFAETVGLPTRFSLGIFDLTKSKVTFSHLDDLPVVTFYTSLMTPAEALLKRTLDIVISLVGLMVVVVVYPWISWQIRKESPGPVIFKQMRVGENGRRFKCYKFRTMTLDAESLQEELVAANQMKGPLFKIQNDPRVTSFGDFLRRTSLDELPQFLNVIRGDMSLVGTRPPTPAEVALYETAYKRRLSIRPGLTGLWQVSGRNTVVRFEDVLALDLEYIDNWSLWLDLTIIVKTVSAVVFRKGAF